MTHLMRFEMISDIVSKVVDPAFQVDSVADDQGLSILQAHAVTYREGAQDVGKKRVSHTKILADPLYILATPPYR